MSFSEQYLLRTAKVVKGQTKVSPSDAAAARALSQVYLLAVAGKSFI